MIDLGPASDSAGFPGTARSGTFWPRQVLAVASPLSGSFPATDPIRLTSAVTLSDCFVTADFVKPLGESADDVPPFDSWASSVGVNVLVTDDSTSRGSSENGRNEETLAELRQFSSRVVSLTRECVFEFGIENELDSFLRESLARNAMATQEWLNELFLRYFGDVSVAVGILRAIAHLEYDLIYPAGPTMAVAALSHQDVEARECGIRAFENWESPDSLIVLEAARCDERWLQEYLEQVVAGLRERQRDVVLCAED